LAPRPPLPILETPEADFSQENFSGRVRLGNEGSLSRLDQLSAARHAWDAALLQGSRFLSTRPVGASQPGVWKLRASSARGLFLEMPWGGGALEKEFRFEGLQGMGTLILRHRAAGNPADIILEVAASLPYSDTAPPETFVGFSGKKGWIVERQKKKQREVSGEIAPGKPLQAVGVSSRYHLALVFGLDRIPGARPGRDPENLAWSLGLRLDPGQEISIPFYVGLKREDSIRELGLENMLYGGMLGSLKRVIVGTLNHLFRWTGNYGVAIILLTLAFQMLLLPLTWKNIKLTRKMKDLMPKVQILQQKYKNDPRKMNTEVMALYRAQGANPLGGCLLLLPQMPIFIALYSALNEHYALFGAPFVLWIQNLADHDPTYLLPLIMGAAMFLQTKFFSPPAADPSQKMIGYVMPVMFTFMFLKFPAGLVLYWLTSNLVSIGLNAVLPKFMEKIT